jgi:DNA-binding beta-propeller fold protein YncE
MTNVDAMNRVTEIRRSSMKRYLAVIGISMMFLFSKAQAQNGAPLKLIQTIPLPGVEGYFDHLAVDVKGERLFIPGEHQRTLEVIDLRAGKVIHTISGFDGNPRKTIYLPQSNQIWVDMGNGTCKAFSSETYQMLKDIQLNPDSPPEAKREPDNGIYDPSSQMFYIGDRGDRSKAGTKGSIEIVDTKNGTYAGSITVDDSDPAGLALDGNGKLYVVLGMTSQVAVIDLKKREVVASWPITEGPLPHALGMDTVHRRLFIGSRVKPGHIYKPGKMVVMDADTGKVIDAIDTEGGADEVVYDAPSKRVYFTGTTGGVDVFKQVDPDHYERLGLVPSGALAKTSLLVRELNRFYVVVPKHIILTPPIPQSKEAAIEDAKVLVYEVMP